VTVYWLTPSGRKVASAVKPVAATEVSDIGSPTTLPAGTWQAVIEAHGRIAGRAKVRIG
jgi:hypothetical protein